MAVISNPPAFALQAQYIGFVFSTTECGVAVRNEQGFGAYASVPMEARATWQGWPAHYLEHVPHMLMAVFAKLQKQGWSFSRPGYLSQSWRQHDLAILDADDNPLIPAPSWECNGAVEEIRILKLEVPSLIRSVGRVEPRFAVAKLPWVLRMEPALKPRIQRVMFSGDWVSGMLTGKWRLSTSDALCNGLLDQRSRTLATDELRKAKRVLGGRIDPGWFPDTIASSEVVGRVRLRRDRGWDALTRLLRGWNVVASLGDNQATAAGSGTADHNTIVISLGTSGTVNRACEVGATLRGKALNFEYWDDRLLLMMLPACGAWYDRFRKTYESGIAPRELNEVADRPDLTRLQRIHPPTPTGQLRDLQKLSAMPRAERIASIQCSIALELLDRCRTMLSEVRKPRTPVERFVLTGGLAQSPLIRHALCHGLGLLTPGAAVLLNSHRGALAYKTDALGAIYNATMAHSGMTLRDLIERESHPQRCHRARDSNRARLESFLAGAMRRPATG